MTVKTDVKIDAGKIKQLSAAAVTSLEQTAEAVHTEVVQATVVPRDEGTLQNEAFFLDRSQSKKGKVTLVHNTPYARRLYYHPEYDFQTDKNPNAKGNWFEDWQAGGKHQDFAAKAFKELYKRNGGL